MPLTHKPTTGVIIDTDIGYDADDFFALLLLLNSPELTLDLIVTGDEAAGKRALLVKKILQVTGRDTIPIAQGADLGNDNWTCDACIPNVSEDGIRKDAVQEIKTIVDRYDQVLYIGMQGMTNLSHFLETYPESKKKLLVLQMAGAIGYTRHPGWTEHNVRVDVESARNVLASGVDLTFIMAQTTSNPTYKLSEQHPILTRLKNDQREIYRLLWENTEQFHRRLFVKYGINEWSSMHDPLTVSVALGKDFVDFSPMKIVIDEQGNCFEDPSGVPVKVSNAESRPDEFFAFLESRIFR